MALRATMTKNRKDTGGYVRPGEATRYAGFGMTRSYSDRSSN